GRPYPVRALSPTQQALLEKFISFGLIYQDDRHSRHFYPTAVAVNLIFGGTVQEERLRRGHGHVGPEGRENTKELRLVDPSQLAVIVETNYQLVAYTSSSLHVEMLRIFTDVRCRLPNVVIGFITRASVRRAMASGITAATILSFLKTHTHVAVRAGKGRLLPENVEAQIELWHQERSRVKFEEVMMIDLSSLMVEEFEEVRTYAENLAVVCWA
ncbi:transcription initiation factor TFIIH subunit 4, partial [Nannochloropsis gaditana CCMP526]|uniref:transcription initiation factor TFIIH subunit 4 n=1 Tax=Nannochloropsis gaditana (strain CCMP526) TaxID=1093141 RepID=UPI00029F68C5